MDLRTIAAAAALAIAAGCSTQPAALDRNKATDGNEATAAPAPAPANPIQTRYDRTITGQPLSRPPTPFQLLVTRAQFPPDHVIECHRHTWPRYVYLQAGHLRVTTYNPLRVHDFTAGQVVVEAIDQWHEGRVIGPGPVILVAFEQVPPGQNNSTPWTPPPPNSPCTPPG
jgi:quercetin dioxygenase-like cupin family protein